MIHLYALARGSRLPSGFLGVEGAELEIVPCGSIEAVVSQHEHAPTANRAGALRHAAVVAKVAQHAEVVPVSFGVQHRHRAGLQDAVGAAAPELLRSLRRVGGYVEFVVRHASARGTRPPRALEPPDRSAPDGSAPDGFAPDRATTGHRAGRRHLEERLLAEQRRARDAEWIATAELRALTSPLDGQAAVVVDRAGPHGPQRCFLVERDALVPFTAAASACLEDREELVLGGPCPPYTSATEELGT